MPDYLTSLTRTGLFEDKLWPCFWHLQVGSGFRTLA